jgi:CubicO group peptidase (beta-lactamase class C family)
MTFLVPTGPSALAEDFTAAIRAYLERRVEAEKIPAGIVVGIVDRHGSHIVSYGRLTDFSDQPVDGDTVFEIGSVGKTFTTLLLQDMIERGQMKLDDPVAMYLPDPIKLPSHGGKQITLQHLATHTSGLPGIPDNLEPKRADNPYADYTVDRLYAFLARFPLTREPGAIAEYSNLGMGLLGHAIERKAGANYESLVIDRICRPLGMDSTRITLTPEMKARFATAHNKFGEPVRHWDVPTLAGAGALRSTANDLLKYVSANIGLAPAALTPLMERTHLHGLAWQIVLEGHGTKVIGHGGGTAGCSAFVGFDKAAGRGAVVLTNISSVIDIENLGIFLLVSEWNSHLRPNEVKRRGQPDVSYVGQYQPTVTFPGQMRTTWQQLGNFPRILSSILAICCVAMFVIVVRRGGSFREQSIIIGCSVLVSGVLAILIATASNYASQAPSEAGIGIRREGNHIFAQRTSLSSGVDLDTPSLFFPPIEGELLPESEARFFERLSGKPVLFFQDSQRTVTGLSLPDAVHNVTFEKISDEPPKAPVPVQPRTVVRLDANLLDAVVGTYWFSPNADLPAGMKLTIQRDGDHLVGRATGKNVLQGLFDIYPESESTFFIKVDGARLTFIKNNRGEVSGVTHHYAGFSDILGHKLAHD